MSRKATEVLDLVLDDMVDTKYHLVTDDEATVLVHLGGGEWWLISARRSDKEGHHVH